MLNLIEKLEDLYYNLIPYEYRHYVLWQQFKDWAFYRRTTIKSRLLSHSWIDKTDLIPYTVFEMFVTFYEEEAISQKCYVDWSYHKIKEGDLEVDILTYWTKIYEWWNNYLKLAETTHDKWHEFHELHCETKFVPIEGSENLLWEQVWDTPENEIEGDGLFREAQALDVKLDTELTENLIKIVKTRQLMWT